MTGPLYAPLADGDLRLEPIAERHREGLRAATAADSEIWAIYPTDWAGEAFDASFANLLAAGPQRRGYAVFAGERLAGMTAWIERGDPAWGIEIGNSYIAPDLRGTGFNGRLKRLMIAHAFACGLRRVEFRVDERNLRSQAAVLKLGAQKEGALRSERQTWTGHVRDTAVFSILADEWVSR
ncbi:MAG: GNAT family protein [Candidatus Andeanibacterium colombiense]|uniref:GNAT family protein n=1 Tax=Candidatus Andeanibacterium colombiense TaxID=3121345 RepID=A0AAJ5X8V9_9SPHN|nr:MAG: GNAT family protein [Sphingomonadaceae bacterium]